MNRPRMPSPAILVATLALVAALAGTAVAGPDASTSAITKKKVKKIVTKQINELAPGLSVAHAESANTAASATSAENALSANSATSAQSALSADTANSVGGVSIEPVRIALPEDAAGPDVVSVDGTAVDIPLCTDAGQVNIRIARASPTSPPLTAEWMVPGGATGNFLPPGAITQSSPMVGLSATIRQASGRVTAVFIHGFYEQNAFGGTDDCFVQGTIERFG